MGQTDWNIVDGSGKREYESMTVSCVTLIECKIGEGSNYDGGCDPCEGGYYSDEVAAAECKPFPSGTASDNPGSTSYEECLPCLEGFYSSTGSTSCHLINENFNVHNSVQLTKQGYSLRGDNIILQPGTYQCDDPMGSFCYLDLGREDGTKVTSTNVLELVDIWGSIICESSSDECSIDGQSRFRVMHIKGTDDEELLLSKLTVKNGKT